MIVHPPERPVVPESFGAQDQHAIVPQLMILDDRKGLERLPQAHAVGQNATAEALELVDGPDDAVALETIEFVPDDGVANARRRFDDTLFI